MTYNVSSGTLSLYTTTARRLHGRRALRSASSSRLVVSMFRLSTVGSRTLNVSGPRIWNGLPENAVSAPTLSGIRRRLKPFLFQAVISGYYYLFDTVVVLVVMFII